MQIKFFLMIYWSASDCINVWDKRRTFNVYIPLTFGRGTEIPTVPSDEECKQLGHNLPLSTPVVYFSCDHVCPATLPTQKPLLQSNISSRTSSTSVFTEQKKSRGEEVGWGFMHVADLSSRLDNSEEGLSLIMPDILDTAIRLIVLLL